VRRAWTVADGRALCIRHAVGWLDIEDDMAEHALFEDLYLALHDLGFRNTY
jgi:hypothetical protein